jgi:hypothetical protein
VSAPGFRTTAAPTSSPMSAASWSTAAAWSCCAACPWSASPRRS